MILTDEPGAGAWPIAGATFILLPKQPKDATAAGEALKFFAWAYKNGDKAASDLDYVPMPSNIKKLIETTWVKEVKDETGKPIFAGTM
jgi:phosphate transport system substrate-binding protein